MAPIQLGPWASVRATLYCWQGSGIFGISCDFSFGLGVPVLAVSARSVASSTMEWATHSNRQFNWYVSQYDLTSVTRTSGASVTTCNPCSGNGVREEKMTPEQFHAAQMVLQRVCFSEHDLQSVWSSYFIVVNNVTASAARCTACLS